MRGELFGRLGQDQQALDDFSKALRLDPECSEAWEARADYYYLKVEGGDRHAVDSAAADYGRVIALKPRYMDGYKKRALLFAANKRTDLADKDNAKADELARAAKAHPFEL